MFHATYQEFEYFYGSVFFNFEKLFYLCKPKMGIKLP